MGAPGSSSTLNITAASLNDGAIQVDTAAGSFNVNQVHTVSGQINHWNGGAIGGVTLNLEGDRLYTGVSDPDGTYTVSGAAPGDYILTPEKADEANEITAYDASLVLQHAAGLNTLSGFAATAADVNKNGAITSFDAYYILQKSVDLITLPFPGAGVVWDFDPATRSFNNLSSDQTGQNFSGILLGDVSGSWPAAQGQAVIGTTNVDGAILSLPELTPLPGESFTATAAMELSTQDVYAADIIISYDPPSSHPRPSPREA